MPIEFALGVGVLVLPVAVLVLVLPGWAERQSMARVAAQEAARTVAVAADWDAGGAAAAALVAEIAANHGLSAAEVEPLRLSGSLTRDAAVTAEVTVRMPVTLIPVVGEAGGFSWTARHSEPVDRYRSFG